MNAILEHFAGMKPFPKINEIGTIFYKNGEIDEIVVGDNDEIDIYYEDTLELWGSFHTHPSDSVLEFSEGDVQSYLKENEELVILGCGDRLVWFDMREVSEFKDEYLTLKGKAKYYLLTEITNYINANLNYF